MNEHEREEMEYQWGAASELQNALALSQMERKPDDRSIIAQRAKEGWWVVVLERTLYCPRTDAILGTDYHLEGYYASRQEAYERAGVLWGMEEDPEVSYRVQPPEGYRPERKPQPILNEDELPF